MATDQDIKAQRFVDTAEDFHFILGTVTKHQPGKHDQKTHAGGRGGGTPININPNKQSGTFTDPDSGKTYKLWEDVEWIDDEDGQDNWRIELGGGIQFENINEGQPLLKPDECESYVREILDKHGFADRLFVTYDQGDTFFPKASKGDGHKVEAAISKAIFPPTSPLAGKDIPTLIVRQRGTTKLTLLHETAHMMEGSWLAPENKARGGHNVRWFDTWLTLLEREGFQGQANVLRFTVGDNETKGIFND